MDDFSSILPPNLQGITANPGQVSEGNRKSLGQDEFFQLMVAQLQNQDPLKPLESNDFLAQVAQFSSLQGIQSMEESIRELASSMQSSQALQASLLVGREVLVAGQVGTLNAGATLSGAVELVTSSGSVSVDIFDDAGQLARHLDLGAHPAGQLNFTWDGITDGGQPAPPGNYSIRASGLIDGDARGLETLVRTQVESVTLGTGPGGVTLNLHNLGARGLSEVRELL